MLEEEGRNHFPAATANVSSNANNQTSTCHLSNNNKGTIRVREVNAAEVSTSTAARKRATFGNRPDDYQQEDLRKKGMFLSNDPKNAHLLLPSG